MGRRQIPILLVTALLLAACHAPAPKGGRVDRDLVKFVPPDAVLLMAVDVARIRATPVYQKYVSQLTLPGVDRFVQETGIDPRKDIDAVLAWSNGNATATLVRGRYNRRDLESRLRARAADHSTYGKYTLYGNGQSVIAFINDSVAVGGSSSAVKAALDTRDQGRGGLPGSLKPLVEALDPADQLWATGAGSLNGMGLEAQGNSRLADIAQLLRGVRAALAGIDISNGLNLTGRVDCDTDDSARHIHDALRGVIGMARLSTPDNQPQLLQLYDAINVNQVKSSVTVSANIPADQADAFLSLWLKQRR